MWRKQHAYTKRQRYCICILEISKAMNSTTLIKCNKKIRLISKVNFNQRLSWRDFMTLLNSWVTKFGHLYENIFLKEFSIKKSKVSFSWFIQFHANRSENWNTIHVSNTFKYLNIYWNPQLLPQLITRVASKQLLCILLVFFSKT